ncbi:MAG: cation transporter [Paludibacteraceae bacterium]|nr:cation transporter [Paludibacteraceae bacterium]
MKKLFLSLAVAMIATMAFAEKQTVRLYIPGMECAGCQAKVENVLNHEKGVKSFTITLDERIAEIIYDDEKTNVETLQAALEKYLKFKSMPLRKHNTSCSQCGSANGEHKGCNHQGCNHDKH